MADLHMVSFQAQRCKNAPSIFVLFCLK